MKLIKFIELLKASAMNGPKQHQTRLHLSRPVSQLQSPNSARYPTEGLEQHLSGTWSSKVERQHWASWVTGPFACHNLPQSCLASVLSPKKPQDPDQGQRPFFAVAGEQRQWLQGLAPNRLTVSPVGYPSDSSGEVPAL